MTKRRRFVVGLLVGLSTGIGAVTYATWAIFYDHIMGNSEVLHVNAEEVKGTHPLQLKITVATIESAPVIRTVTTKRRPHSMTVLYHLALSGLAKPTQNWDKPYLLTVPDSVDEVRFGRDAELIWQRPNDGE